MTDNTKNQSEAANRAEDISLMESNLHQLLQDKNLTGHIRDRLRKMVVEELSELSPLLREALRDWVKNFQSTHVGEEESTKLISFEKRISDLVEENNDLKRKLELKGKESKMMLEAIKQLMSKKKEA